MSRQHHFWLAVITTLLIVLSAAALLVLLAVKEGSGVITDYPAIVIACGVLIVALALWVGGLIWKARPRQEITRTASRRVSKTIPAQDIATDLTYTIKAYADCDHTVVVWKPSRRIPQCRGFALYRRRNRKAPEVVDTWLGFNPGPQSAGTHQPSTIWPIQRFLWSDYLVRHGDRVSYRVVPVVGPDHEHLAPCDDLASLWTAPVMVSASVDHSPFAAYFNRGILASQWVARLLKPRKAGASLTASLTNALTDPKNLLRRRLAGPLRGGLLALLDEAQKAGQHVYAALYQLNDEELIGRLLQFGPHAHVVLANDTDESGEDNNAPARRRLKRAKCEVFDRLLPSGHLGHNKFLVVCQPDGTGVAVWTGSTNWTWTGLCTQVNNGLLLRHPDIARIFREQWERLAAANSTQPDDLKTADATPHQVKLEGGRRVTVWFAPSRKQDDDYRDLAAARQIIEAAKEGILFLMFVPGKSDTLLETIVQRAGATPSLYVRGVVNQDPHLEGEAGVALFHRNEWHPTNMDVVLPAAIAEPFTGWQKELLKFPRGNIMVHSKVIVIDAFGTHPVVITGSHNLGPAASGENDENLVIIQGDSGLASAYAVNILAVYNQYSWRYHREPDRTQPAAGTPFAAKQHSSEKQADVSEIGQPQWKCLQDDDTWQDRYFTKGPDQRELAFWLQERVIGRPEKKGADQREPAPAADGALISR
jgi:phosphatidylserine/phosphatidylglycerophosphate/cardiolipin synthase-like enzyme